MSKKFPLEHFQPFSWSPCPGCWSHLAPGPCLVAGNRFLGQNPFSPSLGPIVGNALNHHLPSLFFIYGRHAPLFLLLLFVSESINNLTLD